MTESGGYDVQSVLPGLGRRIVVVDDDGIQRSLIKVRLEQAGFVAIVTAGAAEALKTIAENPPDAIVSDVLMDELDGFSFCRTLRADKALSRVPVVLLSAYFDEVADTALAKEVGANALVVRSPTFQECIEALVRSLAEDKPTAPPVQDVSDLYVRRLAHQLVRLRQDTVRAEAHYQALFEHARDAVAVLTPDGRVIDVNRRWEEIMKRPRQEFLDLHIRDFSAVGHEDEIDRRYRNAVADGVEGGGPVPIARPDGSTILMEFTAAKFDIDGSENVLTIGRDVTDVVEAQRKLEASERKYRSLVENIPEVVWSTTREGRLTFISSNVTRVVGFSPEEMIEGGIARSFARVHPEDIAHLQEAVAAVIARRGPLDMECRWRHRDGRWLWLHFRGVPALDADGIECIDGVCSDITARKQLEEQLYQSQKVETIGQLTAGIAHDFNNLLMVIISNSEYLSQKVEGDDREVASEIISAAQRGVDLTRGLLNFARRETAEPRELDLNAVLTSVERMLVCTLGKEVSLSLSTTDDLGAMRADPRQIEQVLMNLTVNARDAMPKGGTLCMETSNVDVSTAQAGRGGLPGPGRYVAISVRDTGTGMSQETRERIFEPFFTTKGVRGTGLGLSTSYGIVRRYGGHVAVDSVLGSGTTFTLYFPRVDDPEAQSRPASPMARGTLAYEDRAS